jgi:hypothetical protein
MKVSRRLFLAAAAAQSALPQEHAPSTVTEARSGLRLERFGDPQRPAVALFLHQVQDPSVVIEMPEHAWRKADPDGQQEWFYKMYTTDPALRGQVAWTQSGNRLGFTMTTPSGYVMRSQATLQADGLDIVHEISHKSVRRHAAVEAVTCVKLYRPFTDVFLDRTYVHHADVLDLVASETRANKGTQKNGCRAGTVRRSTGNGGRRGEYRQEKRRNHPILQVQTGRCGVLATESATGNWTAATFAVGCDSVFTNPARTCHHTDPGARGISNGQATLRLKVYLVKGRALEAWRHVSAAERV